jgi:hypothetical protein
MSQVDNLMDSTIHCFFFNKAHLSEMMFTSRKGLKQHIKFEENN